MRRPTEIGIKEMVKLDYWRDKEFYWQYVQSFLSARQKVLNLPKTYDLNIKPNAEAKGIPVEADDDGYVVAVEYANGQQVRNNFHYLVVHGPVENVLLDKNRNFHPLD